MDGFKLIFIYVSVGLSFLNSRGQQIANYISNGSFEEIYNCTFSSSSVKSWTSIDSVTSSFVYMAFCNNKVPHNINTVYQLPRSGNGFVGTTFYNPNITSTCRQYIKNRLKSNLSAGKTYCATFYVNITNMSTYGNDGFGIYFGDSSIDTITHFTTPLSYIIPQVKNPQGSPIIDTLGWAPITGTFVANGNEKYAVIGIFAANGTLDTALINPAWLPGSYTDAEIEDVSCIELNLSAFAGSDKLINVGDSAFLGRQPDFATDAGCFWYRLPNMTTPIDTVSGLWVKPTVTSTYVVRQTLDCSPMKWDTVVVYIKIDDTGIDKLHWLSESIRLFPNPTSGNLNISFSGSVQGDVSDYSFVDNLGRIIREEEIDLKNSSFIVGTSDLASGLYLIHFKTQFGIVTKKFVKTN